LSRYTESQAQHVAMHKSPTHVTMLLFHCNCYHYTPHTLWH